MNRVVWVEFFVEEPSMEAALQFLVPKIRPGLEFQVRLSRARLNQCAVLSGSWLRASIAIRQTSSMSSGSSAKRPTSEEAAGGVSSAVNVSARS
jgi:hypothetical protein